MHRYSSLAAFLAHYETFRQSAAAAMSADDRNRLAAMKQLLNVLRPEERAAIETDCNDSATVRRRQRGLLHLRRELLARGAIDG